MRVGEREVSSHSETFARDQFKRNLQYSLTRTNDKGD